MLAAQRVDGRRDAGLVVGYAWMFVCFVPMFPFEPFSLWTVFMGLNLAALLVPPPSRRCHDCMKQTFSVVSL